MQCGGQFKELRNLEKKYEHVIPDDLPAGRPQERLNNFQIDLMEDSKPHDSSIHRLSGSELVELKRQLRQLIERGFVRRISSPWGPAVLFAAENDGERRMCIDYGALNKAPITNPHSLPRIDDIFDQLRKAKYFSKFDPRPGYHQVRLDPQAIPLMAFRTKDGFFELAVVTFGLANVPAVFMTLMNDVFEPFLDSFHLRSLG